MIVNVPAFPLTHPLPIGIDEMGRPTSELLGSMSEQDGMLFSIALQSREQLLALPYHSERDRTVGMAWWLAYAAGAAAQQPEPGSFTAMDL